MPKNKKSSKAIFEERVSKLIPLVSFMTRRQIIQYVRKNTDWDIKLDQIDRYRMKAQDYVLKGLEDKRKTAIQDITNNLSHLYMKALKLDDFKTALSIQDKMMRLLGVDKMLDEDNGNKDLTQMVDYEVVPVASAKNKNEN